MCPLLWPTLTQTTTPLLASVCSGESPTAYNLSLRPPQTSLSVHLKALPQSTSLQLHCSSLSFSPACSCYDSLISPCLCALFSFPVSKPYLPSKLLLHYYSLSREINLPARGRIFSPHTGLFCMRLLWSPLLSVFSPVIQRGSSSPLLSLPQLLLTF